MTNSKLGPKVKSLNELRQLAETDPRYERLLTVASANLGGPDVGVSACYQWLVSNAMETSEKDVVEEVNFCRDLV